MLALCNYGFQHVQQAYTAITQAVTQCCFRRKSPAVLSQDECPPALAFMPDLIGEIGSFLPAEELGAMDKMAEMAQTTISDSAHKIASVGKELALLTLKLADYIKTDSYVQIGQDWYKAKKQPFAPPLLKNNAAITDLSSLQPLFRKASANNERYVDELHAMVQPLVTSYPGITKLDFSHCKLTNETLALLASLKELRHLNVSDCDTITTSGLEHIPNTTTLTHLNLSGCGVFRTAGNSPLASLTALLHLDVSRTRIRDTELANLAALHRIQRLHLRGCSQLTDIGLQHLRGFTSLQHLDISHTRVSNRGMTTVAALTTLVHLDISRSQITDAELANLANLYQLRHLNLQRCRNLTDRGLRHLTGVAALHYLDLSDCRSLTPAALPHITQLASLRCLHLQRHDWLQKAELRQLTQLPQLRELDLRNTRYFIDNAYEIFTIITQLQHLYLAKPPKKRSIPLDESGQKISRNEALLKRLHRDAMSGRL